MYAVSAPILSIVLMSFAKYIYPCNSLNQDAEHLSWKIVQFPLASCCVCVLCVYVCVGGKVIPESEVLERTSTLGETLENNSI